MNETYTPMTAEEKELLRSVLSEEDMAFEELLERQETLRMKLGADFPVTFEITPLKSGGSHVVARAEIGSDKYHQAIDTNRPITPAEAQENLRPLVFESILVSYDWRDTNTEYAVAWNAE